MNLTSGIRHCDVVFWTSRLHIPFGEADAQKMEKCWGLGKFTSALSPCGGKVFSSISSSLHVFYPMS